MSKLETARINPRDFGAHLRDDTEEPFNNRPKSVRWLDAVSTYHKTGSISKAIIYLENSFSNRQKNKKNITEVENLVSSLYSYASDHSNLKYTYYNHKHTMEIYLSEKVKTTGWIWIINKTDYGGYSGYIVVNDSDSHNWEKQLRFPLIQNYIAKHIFKCESNLVEVGIINYYEGKHHKISYNKRDIKSAKKELKFLGTEISSFL
ncbi:hypothetical protein GGR22_001623 [Flavobacterium gossypii]|uniref:Uncharacterized protein n=1 Tax=Flavobacterium gossypii TaxID=1646119 RepID=A0ABR6DP65_9FLAO|nr:hypothetical protein [Flavobacterium gossypii]MBA9073497.1 hypothetical protein [Flavobacterium gossypii]